MVLPAPTGLGTLFCGAHAAPAGTSHDYPESMSVVIEVLVSFLADFLTPGRRRRKRDRE